MSLVALLGLPGPASAEASHGTPPSQELESGVLVLPAELRAYGVGEKEIARQQALLDSLSSDQLMQQAELRSEQDAITADVMAPHGYIASDGTVVEPDGTAAVGKADVTPKAYGDTCNINTAAKYQVKWRSQSSGAYGYVCVYGPAGTVTYTGGFGPVYAVNSGTLNGRVNYQQDNNYYWSTWRNDGVWHDFYIIPGSVTVFKVQIG